MAKRLPRGGPESRAGATQGDEGPQVHAGQTVGEAVSAASHTSLRSLCKRDETLQVDRKLQCQGRMEEGGRESSPWQEGPHTPER